MNSVFTHIDGIVDINRLIQVYSLHLSELSDGMWCVLEEFWRTHVYGCYVDSVLLADEVRKLSKENNSEADHIIADLTDDQLFSLIEIMSVCDLAPLWKSLMQAPLKCRA